MARVPWSTFGGQLPVLLPMLRCLASQIPPAETTTSPSTARSAIIPVGDPPPLPRGEGGSDVVALGDGLAPRLAGAAVAVNATTRPSPGPELELDPTAMQMLAVGHATLLSVVSETTWGVPGVPFVMGTIRPPVAPSPTASQVVALVQATLVRTPPPDTAVGAAPAGPETTLAVAGMPLVVDTATPSKLEL